MTKFKSDMPNKSVLEGTDSFMVWDTSDPENPKHIEKDQLKNQLQDEITVASKQIAKYRYDTNINLTGVFSNNFKLLKSDVDTLIIDDKIHLNKQDDVTARGLYKVSNIDTTYYYVSFIKANKEIEEIAIQQGEYSGTWFSEYNGTDLDFEFKRYLSKDGDTVLGQLNEQDPNWTDGSSDWQKTIKDALGNIIVGITKFGQWHFWGKGASACMFFYSQLKQKYAEFNTYLNAGFFKLYDSTETVKVELRADGKSKMPLGLTDLPNATEPADAVRLSQIPSLVGAGFESNAFLSNTASATSGYKKLLYTSDASETIKTIVANNNTVLGEKYLYDTAIGVTSINPGLFKFAFHGNISSVNGGTSTLNVRVFLYTTGGTETTLFTASKIITNTSTDNIVFTYMLASIVTCNTTDRFGIELSLTTTRNNDTTYTYALGGGYSAYFVTTLPYRHEMLRDLGWLVSGHKGTALKTPSFGASGESIEIDLSQESTDEVSIGKTAGQNLTVKGKQGTPVTINYTSSNWTLGAGFDATNSGGTQINKNADGVGTATYNSFTPTTGTIYKITITMLSSVSGGCYISCGGPSGILFNPTINILSTKTIYIKARTSDKLVLSPTNTSRFIATVSITPMSLGDLKIEGNILLNGTINSYNGSGYISFEETGKIFINGLQISPTGSISYGYSQFNANSIVSSVLAQLVTSITPTSATYAWNIGVAGNLKVDMSSTSSDLAITTSMFTYGTTSNLELIGHSTSNRSVSITQNGVTFVFNGNSFVNTISFSVLANYKYNYSFNWASSAICYVILQGTNDGSGLPSPSKTITGVSTGSTYQLLNNAQVRIVTNMLESGNQLFKLPIPNETITNDSECIFKIGATVPTLGFAFQSSPYPQTVAGTLPTFAINTEYKFILQQYKNYNGDWIAEVTFKP